MPNLIGIAGPNGSGKSSLLEALRTQRHAVLEPGSELLYVGPHRTWRSSQVSRVSVYGFAAESFLDVLKLDALPSFQYGVPGNLQMLQNLPRLASSADDAQAFVKTSIVRLLDNQRGLVTERWEEQGGRIEPGSVPDLFDPFRLLVETLLPHLEWGLVDDSNKDNIRCLFRVREDSGIDIDIDELSSGEKAAIALFLPFIESQASLLARGAPPESSGVVPLTVLLDEPEIHLHPLLQLNVLEYMRALARADRAQFIFTTHSPTILDALTDDELWLLSPAALAADNQLARLTNDHERLEVARELTGSTHLLTRGKPIVFLEGEPDAGALGSDERYIRLLLPETRHWALVAARDKRAVIEAANRLRSSELALPGQPVFGIVDADRDTGALPDYVVTWPVTMIENLLLDPSAIARALSGFDAVTGIRDAEDAERSLLEIARDRRDEEIALRVQRALPVRRIALKPDDLDDVGQALDGITSDYRSRLEGIDLDALRRTASEEVDEIIGSDSMLKRFHGKRILHTFHQRHHVGQAGLSKPAFATKLAMECAGSDRVNSLAGPTLESIRLFFPADLADALASVEHVDTEERAELGRLAREEREHWETGDPRPEVRDDLRRRVFTFARGLSSPDREKLALLAGRIGTI